MKKRKMKRGTSENRKDIGSFNSQRARRLCSAVAAVSFGLFGVSVSHAQTYDAVSDFTGTNPSGTWSYLWSGSVGASLSPMTTSIAFNSQWSGIYDGQGEPNSISVTRNYGPGTSSYLTIDDPTNLLNVDPENDVADVRWTAPATGYYSVSGLYQMTDVNSQQHEVQILQDYNATSPLLADVVSGYGQQVPFSFSEQLSAGETLDFLVNATNGYSYLSTGFEATITVVPEPASLSLTLAGGFALLRRSRRKS